MTPEMEFCVTTVTMLAEELWKFVESFMEFAGNVHRVQGESMKCPRRGLIICTAMRIQGRHRQHHVESQALTTHH